ncbi:hypothetical protein EB169_05755 [archaeon]|nr:hypothetical protein [archaeon]
MRLFTSLVFLSFFCINTSHGGGVTVGNGQGNIIVGISLQNQYLYEDQLMKSAEDVIQRIYNGEFDRLNQIIADGNCDPSYVKIDGLKSKRFYILDQGILKKEKEFVGYLQIELKDCQTIDEIMSDEPYGGIEFWEI